MEEDKLMRLQEQRMLNNTEGRRSQNDNVVGLNLDCSNNRSCIWWKRFEDLSQENERQKQQNKINIADLQQLNAELMSDRGNLVKTIDQLIKEIDILKNYISYNQAGNKQLLSACLTDTSTKYDYKPQQENDNKKANENQPAPDNNLAVESFDVVKSSLTKHNRAGQQLRTAGSSESYTKQSAVKIPQPSGSASQDEDDDELKNEQAIETPDLKNHYPQDKHQTPNVELKTESQLRINELSNSKSQEGENTGRNVNTARSQSYHDSEQNQQNGTSPSAIKINNNPKQLLKVNTTPQISDAKYQLDYPEKPHQQESEMINLSDDSDDNEQVASGKSSLTPDSRNSNVFERSQQEPAHLLGSITEESTTEQATPSNQHQSYTPITPSKVYYTKQSANHLKRYQSRKKGSDLGQNSEVSLKDNQKVKTSPQAGTEQNKISKDNINDMKKVKTPPAPIGTEISRFDPMQPFRQSSMVSIEAQDKISQVKQSQISIIDSIEESKRSFQTSSNSISKDTGRSGTQKSISTIHRVNMLQNESSNLNLGFADSKLQPQDLAQNRQKTSDDESGQDAESLASSQSQSEMSEIQPAMFADDEDERVGDIKRVHIKEKENVLAMFQNPELKNRVEKTQQKRQKQQNEKALAKVGRDRPPRHAHHQSYLKTNSQENLEKNKLDMKKSKRVDSNDSRMRTKHKIDMRGQTHKLLKNEELKPEQTSISSALNGYNNIFLGKKASKPRSRKGSMAESANFLRQKQDDEKSIGGRSRTGSISDNHSIFTITRSINDRSSGDRPQYNPQNKTDQNLFNLAKSTNCLKKQKFSSRSMHKNRKAGSRYHLPIFPNRESIASYHLQLSDAGSVLKNIPFGQSKNLMPRTQSHNDSEQDLEQRQKNFVNSVASYELDGASAYSAEKFTPRFNLVQEPKANQLQMVNGSSSHCELASPEIRQDQAMTFERRKTVKITELSHDDLLWFSKQIQMEHLESNHFFEKYLIAGASEEQLRKFGEEQTSSPHSLLIPQILFQMPDDQSEETLVDKAALSQIQHFCFPNGVNVKKLDYIKGKDLADQSEDTREDIQQVLYQKKTYRENMFVFSLDAAYLVEQDYMGDCQLTCLCYILNDLQEVDSNLYVVQQAICLITCTPKYLPLLKQLIIENLRLLDTERSLKLCELVDQNGIEESYFWNQLQASRQIKYADPPGLVRKLISEVRNYKLTHKDELQNGLIRKICVNDEDDNEQPLIYYEFPKSIKNLKTEQQADISLDDIQYELIEHHWHMPVLFSLFGANTFCKLLTAVLLEKSIVFVGKNPSVISSIVLALKALIRPFQWCWTLVPVFPREILENIETPSPIICGISYEDYEEVLRTIDEQDRQKKTWIFLDRESIPYAPFNSSCEIDSRSGCTIFWGFEDQDLFLDYRVSSLLGWLDALKCKLLPLFADFEYHAKEIKKGNEDDLLETLQTEQITEQSIFEDSKNLEKDFENLATLNRRDTERSGDLPETEDYVPIQLVPNQAQRKIIDQVLFEIACILNKKIISLTAPLCQMCNLDNPNEVLDSQIVAQAFSQLATDKRDIGFLKKFAFMQTFSFMLQQHLFLNTPKAIQENEIQDQETQQTPNKETTY